MQRAKFTGVDDDESPEVKYLLKNIKLEELLPKARDAVNLFFLNIKSNPQQGIFFVSFFILFIIIISYYYYEMLLLMT